MSEATYKAMCDKFIQIYDILALSPDQAGLFSGYSEARELALKEYAKTKRDFFIMSQFDKLKGEIK